MTMTTDNPLSGHTDGANDGLTDGSHILSPSLTNLYEGVHGNGILLPHDTAYDDNDRNDPPDLPGAISAGAAANQFVVKACDVILDGILYAIGGGSDITVTLTSTTAEKLGSFVALNSGEECLFVVVATADGLKVTQTVNITTAAGAYPSISGTAASYLTTGSGAGDNRQTIVLGTVRAVNAGGATTGDLNIESLSEYNDKRVFVRPSPLYFSPVRDGTISATTGINSHTALQTVHTGQPATFGDNGIVWQSFNSAGESMLYYSRKDGSNRHTHLLGPTNIDVSSPSTNQTFTFDGDSVFVLTPSTGITLNPSGTFPPGHTVFVSVPSGSTVTFDSTGLNQAIAAGNALMFAYDGTNWKRVLFSSTVATTSSGASGLVQLSDGAGGFTSDSTLSYDTAANELTVNGKLTVTGLIDPTGLELTPQATNPAAADAGVVDANTLWLDSGASNRLKQGDLGVMRENDDISELNNDAGFVDAAGAAAAAPATNLTYTASTRVIASSTGTDATLTEVVAGGNSGLMTGAQATKLDGIAPSATAYSDSDAIAAVEGEPDLQLTSLTVDTDTLSVDTANDRVGIGTATPLSALHIIGVDDDNPEIRVQRSGAPEQYLSMQNEDASGGFISSQSANTNKKGLYLQSISENIGVANGDNLIIMRTGDDSSPTERLRISDNDALVTVQSGTDLLVDDGVAIGGGGAPASGTSLHIKTSGAVARVESTSNGLTSIANNHHGLEVSANGMNTTSKYGGAIKFMSTDSNFTTNNPKMVGAFVHRATQTFGADDNGASAIDIALHDGTTTDGTGPASVKHTITPTTMGIGTALPSLTNGYGLHIRGALNPEVRLQEDGQNGSTYLRGFADNYGALKVENTTTDESTILDIDVESAGTGNQTVRLFRTANSGAAETELQILAPGTTTETFKVDAGNGDVTTTGTIRQTVTNAVLVANANGDLVAASNLTDTAYSTTDTTDAAVDVYAPANPANWAGPAPTTVAQALDRIAAHLNNPVYTPGPIP